MSDDPNSTSESPVSSAIGTLVMIGIPFILIVMLGFTGVAFVKAMGSAERPAKAAEAAVAAIGTPTPGAPAAGGGDQTPEGIDPAQWEVGRKAFATCAACHGPDGKGFKVGPALMAPSLVGSETLLGDPDQPILVVLKGIKKETNDYMGVMAALGALPDDQIAGVLTYLRNNWGNKATAISTEDVAAAREKFSDFNDPTGVPRAQIGAIIEAHK